jgi:thiol-disulfide isomerase/thioredoxin
MEPMEPDAPTEANLDEAETPADGEAPAAADAPPGRRPGYGRAPRIALVAAVAAAAIVLFWPRGKETTDSGGTLIDESGHPVPLAGELAPVTLVHFWGTWCAPCRTELPELVRFARENSSERLRVLLIAVEDQPAEARRFLAADDLPLFFDPVWNVAHRFGTDALPETHLVVGGEIVRSFIGATPWTSAAVRQEIQKWTAMPASAAP